MIKSRIGVLAGTFLVSSSLPGGALADATSEALVRAFVERIDKDAEWQASAANISSEGPATIVAGLKLEREDGSVSLDLDKLTLDSLALREGGGISLPGFLADTIDIKGAGWTFQAKSFGGKGLKTPSFEDWIFDPKLPVTSIARFYTRLAKTEFVEIALPSGTLDYEAAMPGTTDKTKSHSVYTNLRCDNLSNGVLSSQSIDRMESASQAGTAPAITMIFEGLHSKAVNLAALARVIDPDAYANGKGDGQWISAVQSSGYDRITVKTGDKETVSIGPITLGGMDVRQPPAPFAAAIDDLIVKAGGGKPPDEVVFDFVEKHLSDAVGWFHIPSIEMKDLVATPPEGGEVKLANIGLHDVSSDGLKKFTISGFTANAPQFSGKLGLFEVADIAWPSFNDLMVFARIEESRKNGGTPDPQLIEQAAANILNVLPKYGRIEIQDVSAGSPGTEPFTLKTYVTTNEGGSLVLPKETQTKLDSLVVPQWILRATPESRDAFDSLGYSELVMHAESQGGYDASSGAVQSDSRIKVEDAGMLQMAYGLGGMTPAVIKAFMVPILQAGKGDPDPTTLVAAAAPLSLTNFIARFEDASLTKRLLPYLAKLQNIDEATLIGNTTAMLQLGLSQLKNPTFTQQVVESVSTFLKNPKSITFSVKPSAPVQFLQLMQADLNNPGAVIDLLGVSVKAND